MDTPVERDHVEGGRRAERRVLQGQALDYRLRSFEVVSELGVVPLEASMLFQQFLVAPRIATGLRRRGRWASCWPIRSASAYQVCRLSAVMVTFWRSTQVT